MVVNIYIYIYIYIKIGIWLNYVYSLARCQVITIIKYKFDCVLSNIVKHICL